MFILIFIFILFTVYLIPTYIKPRIITDFMSKDEREYIMKKAEKKLQTSTVSDDRTIDKETRDSETAWLDLKDPIVRRIAERCVSLTDRPIKNC